MSINKPIYGVQIQEKQGGRLHIEEGYGCGEHDKSDRADSFIIDLRSMINESAPYADTNQWCIKCYREVLNLAKREGILVGPDPADT